MTETLKNKGCSACKNSMKIRCSKPAAHSALSYFTELWTYMDKERTGRSRIKSAIDYVMMNFCFFLAGFQLLSKIHSSNLAK